jgi:hypothetical protein
LEAALLMQNALDLTVTTVAGKDEDSDLPTWAVTAMNAMADNGIHLTTEQLTRGQTAKLLYQVSKLAAEAPGMSVY